MSQKIIRFWHCFSLLGSIASHLVRILQTQSSTKFYRHKILFLPASKNGSEVWDIQKWQKKYKDQKRFVWIWVKRNLAWNPIASGPVLFKMNFCQLFCSNFCILKFASILSVVEKENVFGVLLELHSLRYISHFESCGCHCMLRSQGILGAWPLWLIHWSGSCGSICVAQNPEFWNWPQSALEHTKQGISQIGDPGGLAPLTRTPWRSFAGHLSRSRSQDGSICVAQHPVFWNWPQSALGHTEQGISHIPGPKCSFACRKKRGVADLWISNPNANGFSTWLPS